MAHYAKIIDETVIQVNAVDEDFFNANPDRYLGKWVQTSYNTRGGVHLLGGTPLRKNYAGIGFKYDEVRDAFIPPRPEVGNWKLNEDTCLWEEETNDTTSN
jgi:hypothetical protein